MSDVRPPRWEDYEDEFRAEWEHRYPNIPWNDVSLGYRYGWEQANRRRYDRRGWPDAERELQAGWSDWETRYWGSSQGRQLMQSWEDLESSVRYGWEKGRTVALGRDHHAGLK